MAYDTCTRGTCVDCVSRASVSSVSLAVEILRKNNKASQIKCRQRPFWSVSDSSVWWGKILPYGRLSWELDPYDSSSQNIEDFAVWCKVVSKECHFDDRAGEYEVVRFTKPFFILDKAKALPVRIGSQTAWFTWYRRNTINGVSRVTKGQKSTGGGCSHERLRVFSCSLFFHVLRCVKLV